MGKFPGSPQYCFEIIAANTLLFTKQFSSNTFCIVLPCSLSDLAGRSEEKAVLSQFLGSFKANSGSI
jgi:hypothetical protein